MAKNFLAVVNDVLKRASVIQGDAGELTSFTDSSRQIDIDICKAAINDVIQEIYSLDDEFPRGTREGRFTLALNKREYTTETDFEMMAFDNMRNHADGHILLPYRGGFEQMWNDQPMPDDFQGQPNFWIINPSNGKIRIDVNPTSDTASSVFRYQYIKTLTLSATTDLLPFSDQSSDALGSAFAQAFKSERTPSDFNQALFNSSFARGIRYIRQSKNISRYGVA